MTVKDFTRLPNRLRRIVLLAICAFAVGSILRPAAWAAETQLALPGQPCEVEPLAKWSEPEKWVWTQVCEGKLADFNRQHQEPLDPKSPDGWDENRALSSKFLETILLHEPFRSALTRNGVRIIGAWFREPVDLANAKLDHQLWLDESRFESDFDLLELKSTDFVSLEGSRFHDATLRYAKIKNQLNLARSTFTGTLDMGSMEVGGDLFMYGGAEFNDVVLRGAKIGDQLSMTGSTFTGKLNMDSMEVGGDLFMRRGAKFGEVNLSGAKIGNNLEMDGSRFTGALSMGSIQVSSDLIMQKAEFSEVYLRKAEIAGEINLYSSTISGTLNMDSMRVGKHLHMYDSKFDEVILNSAEIGGLIDMHSSKFTGKLLMDKLKVRSSLFMQKFGNKRPEFGEVILNGAKIGDQLVLTGSKFRGKLSMGAIEVGESLLMYGNAEFGEVSLRGAKIDHQLVMSGSKFSGTLNMNGLGVGGNLFMRDDARFADVNLRGAKIGDQLSMSVSEFTGTLNMEAIEISGTLSMRFAQFAVVHLRSSVIGDDLAMTGSQFAGTLSMDSMEIGGNLIMGGDARFAEPVLLTFTEVDSNLDISGAKLTELDLTRTKILGGLWLGSAGRGTTTWNGRSKLTLRNTVTDAIQDHMKAWPKVLELEGFTYSRLLGFGTAPDVNMPARDVNWFIGWLERDTSFSPQPYGQLAAALRQSGYDAKADAILYAGRNRAYDEMPRSFGKFLKYFEMAVIGFGYKNWLAGAWVFLLTFIGALFLFRSGDLRCPRRSPVELKLLFCTFDAEKKQFVGDLYYSFDMLLPIIRLRESHYEQRIKLSPGVEMYFIFHKIVGYALAIFLGAGLSGLAK
ncbi:MAG: hypothetical protein IIA73_02680 [Proteobacteria bacterium]|nr:hypothetical protein [Pseudomonadota bacterium]